MKQGETAGNIKKAWEQIRRRKGGELPTSEEIGRAAGVTAKYARDMCNKLGLDYQHRTPGGAWRPDAEKRDEHIRKHYEAISRSAGRPPTAQELNVALGHRRGSSVAIGASRRLGLELTPLRRSRGETAPKQKPEQLSAVQPVEIPSRAKIFDLLRSGDPAAGGEAGLRAGERYAVTDRIMLLCPVCSSQKLIAPRMHPFWLRNRADEVIFVCSRGCSGQSI